MQVVAPKPEASTFDCEIDEDMEIALSGGVDLQLTEIKEVEFPGKKAFRTSGTLCDRLYDAVVVSTPVYDEACLGEGRPADQSASCFHGGKEDW